MVERGLDSLFNSVLLTEILDSNISYLGEVGEALVGEDRLSDDTSEGKHGSAAVLKLLGGHLILISLSSLPEAKGIEAKLTRLATRALKHLLDGDDRDELESSHEGEHLEGRAGSNSGVVGFDRADVVDISGELNELGCDKTEPGKHGNAAVLDLCDCIKSY